MDLPLQLQTAYQEALQLHAAVPSPSINGSIIRRTKAGNHYWVSRKRAGDSVEEVAIGPDTEEIRERVEAAKQEQDIYKAWSRAASACVSTLRAGRCLAPDMQTGRLLAAIAKTGFFASGGILGGTQAFRHYPTMLSVEAPSSSFSMTGDVDLIASNAVRLSGRTRSLVSQLQRLGIRMDAVFGMYADQPPKWRVEGRLELEFLSSVKRSGETSRLHEGIGEAVQALKYLEFTFVDPVEAVSLYRSGVLIRVPAPERYALHKLIVAQLRSGSYREKRKKDLDQACWLVEILSERRQFELWSAWKELCQRGPKWRNHAHASLDERPDIRRRLELVEEEFGPGGE